MRLGVMQGRLSPPTNNHIQEFPDKWENEFAVLKDLGFSGVEWLITKNCWTNNPIVENTQYVQNFPIFSVCLDTVVDQRISNEQFMKEMLESFCDKILNTSVKTLTIPLLEDSNLESDQKRKDFCNIIEKIGAKFPNIDFSFEAELKKEKLMEIVSLRNNFYVTYDTGNITSYGIDHSEYIKYFKNKINNVHLKDRTFDAKTVFPLTGDTNFDIIFKTLKEINYEGTFIIQTARSKVGKERETILKHKNIFGDLYEKYF